MVKLFIDTRDNQKVSAKIDLEGNVFEVFSANENKRPESILNLIDKVCKEANIKIKDIDEINVEQGPGSYTGLKVGVSVANALSFALGKKVNGRPLEEIIKPSYE